MFRNNADFQSTPMIVAAFRILHCVLFCHAIAIVVVVFFLEGSKPATLTTERIFALIVALPMLLGSFFFLLAATVRTLFTGAIFFCALLTCILIMLPAMTNLYFPMHLVVLCLATVYGLSCVVLIRYLFTLPVLKKK